MKLYLVWNEDKTECVGFKNKKVANYAASKDEFDWNPNEMMFSIVADHWLDDHMGEECTIQEFEV